MLDVVKEYYGRILQGTGDLQTSACCTDAAPPDYLRAIFAEIHEDVRSRYYGCGLIAPQSLEGLTVLDLGCGAGRDVYVLSKLVGPEGTVIGVDMTAEQIELASRHREYHRLAFAHPRSNVRFLQGYIEQLDALDIEPGSVDVVVSNCVVNLSPDKAAVLAQVRRVLRPGGEFYFSDVYADRRVPDAVRDDPELYGECLGGALYWNDFLSLAKAGGFADPRLVGSRPIEINNPVLLDRVGAVRFHSATWRLFNLPGLESACEDYGQAVVYRGTIARHPARFSLDSHHEIETGRVFPVCGNTWRMLRETRFAPHFDFIGEFTTHYGLFPGCGGTLPVAEAGASSNAGPCC